MPSLRESLNAKEFVITSEVGPPKGTDIHQMIEHIDLLKDKVDALNVTDNQSAVVKIGSTAVCKIIKDRGGEPVLQLTCRDRNRLALQSELLSASILGVHNVLCLTGDYISVGDHPTAKPVFDLDSAQLLQAVGMMNGGKDMAGNDLTGATDYLPGASVTPEADPIEPQMLKFDKKVAAGARFFQTQAVFDLDNFKRFMEKARRHDVKILAGILLLISAKGAIFMNKNVPGIFVPQPIIDEMATAEKGKGVAMGIKVAGRLIRQIREQKLCDGVHIMAINRENRIPEILKAAE